MNILTDNSISSSKQDKFGFGKYAGLITRIIIKTKELPFTIGIFGKWGTGKSSLMKLIEEQINTKSQNYKTIWFNPWKYDQKEELWNALIQTILYQIAESGNREVAKKAKSLASHLTWFAFKKGIHHITSGIITEKTLEKMRKAFVKNDELHYLHINKFEEDFTKVVNLYAQEGKLVIFIDDLDRCIPENAITVLESLKLFIGNAKCVFVLGMDHYIVEEGIRHRYGDKIKISGRDYLNKIIQVPFYLPPIPFQNIKDAMRVPQSKNYSESTWRLLEIGLSGNPRQTKRFINCFYLLNEVLKSPEDFIDSNNLGKLKATGIKREDQQFYLAKLLLLQLKYTDFYNFLSLEPESWEIYDQAIASSDSGEQNTYFIEREELKGYWSNKSLKLFMQNTHEANNFPPPPEKGVVYALLNMTSLVVSVDEKIKLNDNLNSNMEYESSGSIKNK